MRLCLLQGIFSLHFSSSAEPSKSVQIRPNIPRRGERDSTQHRRRAHSASQRDTRGIFDLLAHECLFLQSEHLLLLAMIHRHLNWQDGVLVVAVSLHTFAVYMVGLPYRDKLPVHQLCDVLHYCGHGQVYCSGDGAVTGMALMSTAILTIKQIGVDGDGTMTDVQKEQFIGQREEILAGALEYRNHVLIQQSAMVEFDNLLHGHIFAHV